MIKITYVFIQPAPDLLSSTNPHIGNFFANVVFYFLPVVTPTNRVTMDPPVSTLLRHVANSTVWFS